LATRLEHHREQAGSEVRSHHPFARRREQHLLDQVAHVLVGIGRGGTTAPVDAPRVVEWRAGRHVALTLGWTTSGSIGVPVGTHVDEPAWTATGVPPANTRVAPDVHCPVTHGGVDVVDRPHPTTTYGVASVTTG
jgi:hypothetical protein